MSFRADHRNIFFPSHLKQKIQQFSECSKLFMVIFIIDFQMETFMVITFQQLNVSPQKEMILQGTSEQP